MRICFLIVPLILLLAACGGGGDSEPNIMIEPTFYTAFGAPELVQIAGYTGDVMEPFISRDGNYLFFNDFGSNKDIHYASYDSTTDSFTYLGPISALNTTAVEGVPTLDDSGRFYYVSTYNYPPNNANILDTIYVGDFDPATQALVNNLALVPNLAAGTFGHLNFDVEVSPDGSTLYTVDGVFSGNTYPDSSNFVYAVDSGSGFELQTDSAAIFANINTPDLEYAACISRDGLELFFTRLTLPDLATGMYRATRPNPIAAFDVPLRIAGLDGFYEAPALSADEKQLYFHRKNQTSGRFELYRLTRP